MARIKYHVEALRWRETDPYPRFKDTGDYTTARHARKQRKRLIGTDVQGPGHTRHTLEPRDVRIVEKAEPFAPTGIIVTPDPEPLTLLVRPDQAKNGPTYVTVESRGTDENGYEVFDVRIRQFDFRSMTGDGTQIPPRIPEHAEVATQYPAA